MRLNAAALDLPQSGIRAIMDAAWGRPDVLHLETGEPNFATPEHIVRAANDAAVAGHTGYTPTAGIPALREALAEKVQLKNGIAAAPEQVVLSNGGCQALYATMVAMTEPGDEILLPDPGWPNFAMMAALLGLKVTYYPLKSEDGFLPDPEVIDAYTTSQTKILLLNSPSNPVGSVVPTDLMLKLLDVAARNDLWVISDECYDEITFTDQVVSAAALDGDGRVATVFSFSKTYAMTGWRLGYVVAPPALAQVLAKAQQALISCLNTPVQYAALAALSSPANVLAQMTGTYRARRDAVAAQFTASGIPAFRPAGAFYTWVDISDSQQTSQDFALRLLAEKNVAVAPGTAFGHRGEGFVRISLAAHEDELAVGVDSIAELCLRR